MAETTSFTAGTANEADWATMHRTVAPDGLLVSALTTDLGDVTVTGSDTVLTIAPHEAMVDGYLYRLDASLDLDAADFGVAPSAGQSRVDVLVYEYDSSRDPEDRIQLKIKPGVSAVSPVYPTLTRTEDLWESEKLRYTWVSGASITTSILRPQDYRVGAVTIIRPGSFLPSATRSRLIVRGDELWAVDDAAVKNTWAYRRLDSPAWTPANLASAWELLTGNRAFQWRFHGGFLQITGSAHYKTVGGSTIPISAHPFATTVCTIPRTSIADVAAGTHTHSSWDVVSGQRLDWSFTIPTTGSATLQVQSGASNSVVNINLALFQIPVGA